VSSSQRRHKTVLVEIGPWKEEVDELLAPLIAAMWEREIETNMSCQEVEPGIAWIEFASVSDLIEFLNCVADYEPGVDTLYNRINYRLTGATSAPVWEYQLNPLDVSEGDERQPPPDFLFTAGLYFPRCDLPTLLTRLKRARIKNQVGTATTESRGAT